MASLILKNLIFLVAFSCYITYSTGLDLRAVARRWAPLVKLAKGEKFRPSSVDFFLKYVKLVGADGPSPLTPYNLPPCNENCYLETIEPLATPETDDLKVFFGQPVNCARTYAILRSENSHLTIKYWFFYPYNRGKEFCTPVNPVPPFIPGSPCVNKVFGNHVGDWENIEVRLTDENTPHSIGYSAHGVLRVYVYDGSKFKHESGEILEFCGSHPVAYSALGTHGSWSRPGRIVYRTIPAVNLDLVDETSNGRKWKTWRNLRVIQAKPKGQYIGPESFLNFNGRWGNREEGCGPNNIYKQISGECLLSDGPSTAF